MIAFALRRRDMTTPSTEQPSPEQEQPYPGQTVEMNPRPRDEMRDYEGRGLLGGQQALITGGDSGIGRAVAVAFASGRLSSYYSGEVLAPIGGETLPG
jgi:hypothetical protein